jgi:hypothetical protein
MKSVAKRWPAGGCVRDSASFIDMAESLLSRGHHVRFRADGASMSPAIRDGECITVAPLGLLPIRIGDIVLYRHRDGALVHRVVALRSRSGRTVALVPRGDAADLSDTPIAPDRVLGRVVAVERAGLFRYGWARALGGVRRSAHGARTRLAAVYGRSLRGAE